MAVMVAVVVVVLTLSLMLTLVLAGLRCRHRRCAADLRV
jgi:hypothetical protein